MSVSMSVSVAYAGVKPARIDERLEPFRLLRADRGPEWMHELREGRILARVMHQRKVAAKAEAGVKRARSTRAKGKTAAELFEERLQEMEAAMEAKGV